MSINRALSAPRSEFDLGRPLATRTGKVIHRLERLHEAQELAETSCTKFVKVMVPTKVTLADRKGRWGVMLGTGTLPTCSGCLAAHYASLKPAKSERELLEERAVENIDALPATEQGHTVLQALSHKDSQDVKVGDTVYAYSRGMYRRGEVVKVTPTKVQFLYTTEGAVTEAKRIYDSIEARVPEVDAKSAADQAAKNYAFTQREVVKNRRRIEAGQTLANWERKSFESDLKLLAEETCEEHIARKATEAYEACVAKKAANKSYLQYVHCTTKSVKKDDLYLV